MKRPKCSAGNVQCGAICLPKGKKCRDGEQYGQRDAALNQEYVYRTVLGGDETVKELVAAHGQRGMTKKIAKDYSMEVASDYIETQVYGERSRLKEINKKYGKYFGPPQRNDAAGAAKCDPEKGWVRGPGGKCVRAKNKEGPGRGQAGTGAKIKNGLKLAGMVGGGLLAANLVGNAAVAGGAAIGKAMRDRQAKKQAGQGIGVDTKKSAVNVKATRVDSDYARGYLAAKGVRYDGPDPVEFLNGYLLQRNDAAGGAKCDPEKGWVRGPGGKCVRAKGKKGGMAKKAAIGTAALAAGLGAYALMNRKKKRPQLPGAATPRQLSGANPAQRQLPAARG